MNRSKKSNSIENRYSKYIKGFYSRYVGNLVDIRNDEDWIFRGDSPFGDGDILIGNNYEWYCTATKQSGGQIDFLMKENPLLTDIGANTVSIAMAASISDWNGIPVLDDQSFKKELKLFRESLTDDGYINDSVKINFLEHNFWVKNTSEFYYMELSSTNKPLCRYHWGYVWDSGYFFIESGVSRINEHPDAKTIYFVQNPLQLIILKEYVDDPIYVKPDEYSYSSNDYEKMIAGKEVVFCSADGPFQYTFGDMQLDRYSKDKKDTIIRHLKSLRDI